MEFSFSSTALLFWEYTKSLFIFGEYTVKKTSQSCDRALPLTCKAPTEDKKNKTAGYHRRIFHPRSLIKMPVKRMRSFFFQIPSSSNFVNFPIFKFFTVLQNPSIRVGKRHFNVIRWFDTHSTANLLSSAILKKIQVFRKNIYVFKRAKLWRFWEISLYQSYSTANLIQFGEKKLTVKKCSISNIGHYQLAKIGKKTSVLAFWVDNFPSVF